MREHPGTMSHFELANEQSGGFSHPHLHIIIIIILAATTAKQIQNDGDEDEKNGTAAILKCTAATVDIICLLAPTGWSRRPWLHRRSVPFVIVMLNTALVGRKLN